MIGHLQDNITHERGIGLESSLRWLEIEEAPDAASEGRREQHPRWRLPSNSSTWFGRVGVTYYLYPSGHAAAVVCTIVLGRLV